MWKRFEILLAALLLASAGTTALAAPASWESVGAILRAATVNPNDIDIIVTQAARRQVEPGEATRWAEALLRMRESGLPLRPGVDRVQQGLAKNILPESIDRALATLNKDLAWGKKLVDLNLPDKGGDAGRAARKAALVEDLEVAKRLGYDMSDLGSLLTEARLDLGAAGEVVALMTTWSAHGLKPDFVLATIQETLEAGKGMAYLAQLNQLVESHAAQGAGAEAITRAVEEQVMNMMRGTDMSHHSADKMKREIGTQTPLLDLHGGAGINEAFISPTGDMAGSSGSSGGSSGSGGSGGSGGGGMWGGGGHHGGMHH